MNHNRARIYTTGHGNHLIERLIELLRQHAVTAVIDVRSQPFSRHNPAVNREPLAAMLKRHGIAYAFQGEELGARSRDPDCYVDGRVQYRRLAQTDLFQSGVRRVLKGASRHQIALLCAEKEPLACHRTFLVAAALEEAGARVEHILEDGSLESQTEALRRLPGLLGLPPPISSIPRRRSSQRRSRSRNNVSPTWTRGCASTAVRIHEDLHDRLHQEIG